jgi:hemolysin activation/secretion protein
MQRTQRLSDSNFLIAQLDLQLSPSALPPSQQFLIGGGQSIRGYRQNARSGDNGIRFSLENRMAISRNKNGNATLQLAPFLDLGAAWNNKTTTLRLDYALPFRNLQDRALYFNLNYHH